MAESAAKRCRRFSCVQHTPRIVLTGPTVRWESQSTAPAPSLPKKAVPPSRQLNLVSDSCMYPCMCTRPYRGILEYAFWWWPALPFAIDSSKLQQAAVWVRKLHIRALIRVHFRRRDSKILQYSTTFCTLRYICTQSSILELVLSIIAAHLVSEIGAGQLLFL